MTADTLALTGVIATSPRKLKTAEGLAITSFRFASYSRRFDAKQQRWIDADTNWFTVTCFRRLAENAGQSLEKGDHIFVSGRLRIRDWEAGERSGTNVEIDADSLGPDLFWGTSRFTKRPLTASADTGIRPENGSETALADHGAESVYSEDEAPEPSEEPSVATGASAWGQAAGAA